ncbi:MAG TPA: ribosome biogenesis GTPase Der, partial [Bryobacteraceae bacterium]
QSPVELPVVVIVGRPNVGKSTLFNAITRSRRSIVGDEPGITRDRIHGEASHDGRRFELIDTGGIIQNDAELIPSEILKQARVALSRAAQIVFLIDGRTEITGADRDLAKMLRQIGKPVTLAVNKIDSTARESLTHEFHVLGFRDLFPVSAEHRLGLSELLDHVTRDFERSVEIEPTPEDRQPIKVAIIGRPNVGKSTLLNRLVGEERSIVSPIAGTTRDAVDESIWHNGVEFVFVDTAGIRRKGKTKLMAEKLSVVMARRHIRMANVVVLVMDASEGMIGLDATIAGYAHEEGRAVVLCVNKWDVSSEKDKRTFVENMRDTLKFLDYAQVAFVSAKTGAGVVRLFGMIRDAFNSASKRVSTGELNRFVERLDFDRDIKIYYMTQASVRPPSFIAFTDKAKNMHFSTERFLMNQLRKRFGFEGTPIVIKAKRR